MARALLGFWLRRFAQVFTLGLILLGGLAWLRGGTALTHYAGALGWSAAAAALAASIATAWGWRRRCQMVFSPPGDRERR